VRHFTRLFDDDGVGPRGKTTALYAILIAANLAAWSWAGAAFGSDPVLLGTALLAYGLGLRHAVDADHIAAIDNVTRTANARLASAFFCARTLDRRAHRWHRDRADRRQSSVPVSWCGRIRQRRRYGDLGMFSVGDRRG